MPVELMDAIGEANAASSSPDPLVGQEDAALVAGAKTGTLAHSSYWSNGTRGRFF